MQINIIGFGKLAQTLARLIIDNKLACIAGIYNRTRSNAEKNIHYVGNPQIYDSVLELPHANLTFITTADDCIVEMATQYAANPNLQVGDVVVHCSGVLASSCMQVLQDKGCRVCSVHPMHSFIDPETSIKKYAGTYCAIEGDSVAVEAATRLFTAIGSKVFEVDRESKPLYHAAGVFASNYLLTLAAQSLSCLEEAQVADEDALNLVVSLMQSTLNNLATKKSARDALTGPLRRGDHVTIQKHLHAFSKAAERDFYQLLAERTKDLLL